MIILVGHEKGGVGKSTISINLAYLLASQGKQHVALVDTDESRNTSRWGELRTEMGIATNFLITSMLDDVATNIVAMSKMADIVVVDVGAGDYKRMTELSKIVDLWIAPTLTGQKEADSNANLIDAFNEANHRHKHGRIPLVCVFNRTPPQANSAKVKAAIEALREYDPGIKVLDQTLVLRSVYEEADKQGKTIFEMPPSVGAKACADFVNMVNGAMQAQAEYYKDYTNGN